VRLGGRPPTAAQRISQLDQVIGCPSCADLSVAESNASTAVAIRQFVAKQVEAGRSDTAIEKAVESSYGTGVILEPPASGLSFLVWVLPGALVAVAVVVLVGVLGRRRRRGRHENPVVSDEDRELVEAVLRG
jgi:cytochrome c-type biogenesis protein CcmH